MAACSIRQCRESDWSQLEGMFQEQDGEFLPMARFAEFCREIRQPGYFVAERNGEIIGGGGINMRLKSERACFYFGLVKKSHQKQGVGTALFYARASTLPDIGQGWSLILTATPFSLPIYEKFGFFWVSKFWDKKYQTELCHSFCCTKPGQLKNIRGVLKKFKVEVTGSARIDPEKTGTVGRGEFKTKPIPWITESFSATDRRFLRQTLTWTLCLQLFSAIRILIPAGVWLGLLLIYPYKFVHLFSFLFLFLAFLIGGGIFATCYLGPRLYRDFRRGFRKALDLFQILRAGEKQSYRVSIRSFAKCVYVDDMKSLWHIVETRQNETLFLAPSDLEVLQGLSTSELNIFHFLTKEGKFVEERFEPTGDPKKPIGIVRVFSGFVDYFPKHLTLLDVNLDDFMKSRV